MSSCVLRVGGCGAAGQRECRGGQGTAQGAPGWMALQAWPVWRQAAVTAEQDAATAERAAAIIAAGPARRRRRPRRRPPPPLPGLPHPQSPAHGASVRQLHAGVRGSRDSHLIKVLGRLSYQRIALRLSSPAFDEHQRCDGATAAKTAGATRRLSAGIQSVCPGCTHLASTSRTFHRLHIASALDGLSFTARHKFGR